MEWNVKNGIGMLTLTSVSQSICREEISIDKLGDYFSDPALRLVMLILENHEKSGGNRAAVLQLTGTDVEKGRKLIKWLNNQPVPMAALVKGACYDSRLELALMADIRLCTEESSFCFIKSSSDFLPGIGLERRCRLLLGMERGRTYHELNGKTIDAEQALKMRLVNCILKESTLWDDAFRYINKFLTEKPLYQLKSIMKCFNVYKNYLGKADDEILLEEETKQLFYLVHKVYYKDQNLEVEG